MRTAALQRYGFEVESSRSRILRIGSVRGNRVSVLSFGGICFKCFALGSWITKHARITTLKISAKGEKGRWLDALFDTIPKHRPPYDFSNA